jgi:predicted regulator of Ras-like GTPase activity (Roadblock/LC7/MglB family)
VQVIANACPEPVLHDIASFGLANSRIEVPLAIVEVGLKVGRIEFAWRELCGWLNPPSKPAQVSINGENRIALPLGVIAPIFLKARGAGQGRKKANVGEDIPDLFSAAGKPLAPPPTPAEAPRAAAATTSSITPAAPPPIATPTPTPTATPAPVNPNPPARATAPPAAVPAAAVPAPSASAPKKAPTNLSELFGEPNKKTWTPNEIVQRTTQLPNVAGALIALQDGLLVASNMPPELRTETIAAFVPQIFGRLNQYSKELQMGDTKAVSFTVSTGTMQVYNAGIIYFAALSKAGTLLPLAELQLIAGELGRHTK